MANKYQITTSTINDQRTSGGGFRTRIFYNSTYGQWWVFIQDGAGYDYYNSPDGQTWTYRGQATSSTGYDKRGSMDVWYDDVAGKVYILFSIDTQVYARSGTVGNDTITWNAWATLPLGGQGVISNDGIIKHPNNNLYCIRKKGTDNYSEWFYSSNDGISWSFGGNMPSYMPSYWDCPIAISMRRSTDGIMSVRYRLGADLRYARNLIDEGLDQGMFDGTLLADYCSALSAVRRDVYDSSKGHLVLIDSSGNLKYQKYSVSTESWTAELTLDTGASHCAIAIDDSGNLYVFYVKDSKIMLKCYSRVDAEWKTSFYPFGQTFTNPRFLSVAARDYNSKIALMWTEDTDQKVFFGLHSEGTLVGSNPVSNSESLGAIMRKLGLI